MPPQLTPTRRQSLLSGYVETYEPLRLPSERGGGRRVDVYVPRQQEAGQRAYRVVYMNDGHTALWEGGLANQTWNVASALEQLADSDAEPTMVVAIHPVNRNREYTHTRWSSSSCCGLDDYTKYVASGIKSFVDEAYPTTGRPADNMIVGGSHAGLAAFYMACQRSDAFGWAAAFSPSFWIGLDDAEQFPIIAARPDRHLEDSLLIERLDLHLSDSSARPRLVLGLGARARGWSP